MQKVPVESLGLFEQLDRTVVAFLKKKTSPNPDNFYVSISEEDYEKKKEEFEKSKKRYGSPKITKVINSQGIKVSQKE